MDIKDVHEHGQGELVDAWDEEDGGERAAALARNGFLPELTPVFPGVTAPVPQDPLGNDGGPAPPPPWITRLRNCNVRSDFQNFLNALYAFHEDFNKPKYAATFSVMRYPMHAFLQSILASKPPQDVLISTFSGSMQAQVQLLILKKSGRSNTASFYRHVNAVCITLTTFINTCQAGIRQFRDLEEKGVTHFAPDALATAVHGANTPASPVRVHQSLIHMEPIGELIRKIDALDATGGAPSWTQVVKSSFHYYPRLMILATVLLGFAIGGMLQSTLLAIAEVDRFQSSSGIDVRLFLPLLMALIAIVISAGVIIRRVRWMKLDYSARKKAESDDAKKNRLSEKKKLTKQERSRRLVSSSSDDADHTPSSSSSRSRTTSAPIEFDDRHKQQKSSGKPRAPAAAAALPSAATSFARATNGMAAQQQYSSTGTAARMNPDATYNNNNNNNGTNNGYQSGSSGTSVPTSNNAGGITPRGSVVTRQSAATIVLEENPFMAPHISGTIAANTAIPSSSSSSSAITIADSTITAEPNPFMNRTTSGHDDDDDDHTGAAAAAGSFVLPPYDASLLGTSPFSAPPPLPGDEDSKRSGGKKKKKPKQPTATGTPTSSGGTANYSQFD